MTVRSGGSWGEVTNTPPDLLVVADDAELCAAVVADSARPVTASSGDLRRTVGVEEGRPIGGRIRRYVVDLVDVVVDSDRQYTIIAHAVARSRWTGGGWFRGRIWAAMNAEFVGAWDVAPRGHPNDGRVDVVDVSSAYGVRDRLSGRQRVLNGAHVPHPAISIRPTTAGSWEFDPPLGLWLDGHAAATARTISVSVRADAAIVYF